MTIRTEVGIWVSLSAAGTTATGCPAAPDATATIDGMPMKVLTAGGATAGSAFPYEAPSCQAPLFAANDFTPDGGVVQFVVSDGSGTFSTEVTGPRTVRSPRLASGDGGTLQSGGRAIVVWPVENESLNRETTQIVLRPADGGLWHFVRGKDLEFSGWEVSFTVPTTLQLGSVSLGLESSRLPLSNCSGPSSCILDHAGGGFQATVVP